MARYADYFPGAAPAAAAPAPPRAVLDGSTPWLLRREPDGCWSLLDPDGGWPPVDATGEPIGVIDAALWAADLIDAEAGVWIDIDTERGEDDESGLYRWRAGTDHIQRCGD